MNLLSHLPLLAQSDTDYSGAGSAAGGIVGILFVLVLLAIELAIVVLVIAGIWKVFVKAGKPGWAAIVPVYNMMVMGEIAGKSSTYGLLCLIPFAGIIFAIIIIAGVGKAFGKDGGFIAGLILLAPVFFPILGFGKSQYLGAPGGYGGYPPGGGYGGTLPPGGYPAQGGYPPPPPQGGYQPQGGYPPQGPTA